MSFEIVYKLSVLGPALFSIVLAAFFLFSGWKG